MDGDSYVGLAKTVSKWCSLTFPRIVYAFMFVAIVAIISSTAYFISLSGRVFCLCENSPIVSYLIVIQYLPSCRIFIGSTVLTL